MDQLQKNKIVAFNPFTRKYIISVFFYALNEETFKKVKFVFIIK